MRFKILLVLSAAFSCFGWGSFGSPQYFWTGAWLSTYSGVSCSSDDLPRATAHKAKFLNALSSGASANGRSYLLQLNYENSTMTYASFASTDKNSCDVVFWTGHGDEGSGKLLSNDCYHERYFPFGGSYTKWVFLEACHFFQYNKNPWSYDDSLMNGAHCVYSFASNYKWFKHQTGSWWCCTFGGCKCFSYSDDRWTYMWERFFSGNYNLWGAYSSAMGDSHAEGGYGVEVAAVTLYGTLQDDNGHTEYNYLFACPTKDWAYEGLIYPGSNPDGYLNAAFLDEVFGTPSY